MQEMRFCQSCAMPLEDSVLGTNKDGSKNQDYCHYCFKDGEFTKQETMQEMIETCVPFMVEANPGMTPEAARAQMNEFFPQLKRWMGEKQC